MGELAFESGLHKRVRLLRRLTGAQGSLAPALLIG